MDDPVINQLNFFRVLCVSSSLLSLSFLTIRNYYFYIWERDHFSSDTGIILFYKYKEATSDPVDRYQPHKTTICNLSFVFEFLVLAIQPIPYYDSYVSHTIRGKVIYYYLSECLNAIMALRIFVIARVIFNYSSYTDVYTKKLCQ